MYPVQNALYPTGSDMKKTIHVFTIFFKTSGSSMIGNIRPVMYRLLFSFFPGLLFSLPLYSQGKHIGSVEKIPNTLSVTTWYINRHSFLRISARENKTVPSVIYAPNVRGGLGGAVSYKGLSLGYTFKLPQNERYGNTQFTDIFLGYQGRHIGFSFFYLRYRSLYLKNPEEIGYPDMPDRPLRPDIGVSGFALQSDYAFRKGFSVKAAFAQTERQRESTGSFVLMFSERFTSLKNDSSFIPYILTSFFDQTHAIADIRLNTLSVAPGAAYTLVLSHDWSITTMLNTGWGFQMKFYRQEGTKRFGAGLPFFIRSKSAIGYNGEKLFCRLVYYLERNNILFRDSRFAFFSSSLQFSIGYRIL